MIKTYALDLLLGHLVNGLGDLTRIVRLAAVDKGRAGGFQTGSDVLEGFEGAELGERRGLLDVFGGHLTGSHLSEHVGNVLAALCNLISPSGESNGQETSVRVGVVLRRDVELREALRGLG